MRDSKQERAEPEEPEEPFRPGIEAEITKFGDMQVVVFEEMYGTDGAWMAAGRMWDENDSWNFK